MWKKYSYTERLTAFADSPTLHQSGVQSQYPLTKKGWQMKHVICKSRLKMAVKNTHKMPFNSEMEEKPFTSSLNIRPEACSRIHRFLTGVKGSLTPTLSWLELSRRGSMNSASAVEKRWGRVEQRLPPSPTPYFPADKWIFLLRTT